METLLGVVSRNQFNYLNVTSTLAKNTAPLFTSSIAPDASSCKEYIDPGISVLACLSQRRPNPALPSLNFPEAIAGFAATAASQG